MKEELIDVNLGLDLEGKEFEDNVVEIVSYDLEKLRWKIIVLSKLILMKDKKVLKWEEEEEDISEVI